VGLGNPTFLYEKTRHNVGKSFIDFVAKKYKHNFDSIKGTLGVLFSI
jgi:peptidyl-tRNA hydrolase